MHLGLILFLVFSPWRNERDFIKCLYFSKRHKRVEVEERSHWSVNTNFQSEHERWGERERDEVTHPPPKQTDGPYKGSFVKNFRFHSLDLRNRHLDLLPNHNAGHKLEIIKPKKDEPEMEFKASPNSKNSRWAGPDGDSILWHRTKGSAQTILHFLLLR